MSLISRYFELSHSHGHHISMSPPRSMMQQSSTIAVFAISRHLSFIHQNTSHFRGSAEEKRFCTGEIPDARVSFQLQQFTNYRRVSLLTGQMQGSSVKTITRA